MDEKPIIPEKPKGKGLHPNSLANLKLFTKGHPPLGGKPKGSLDYKTRFRKYMETEITTKLPDGTIDKKTILDNIVLAALSKAAKGDMKAAIFAFERTFGKEADKVELTGKNGDPLEFAQAGRLSEIEQRIANAFDSGQGLSLPLPPED